MRLTQITYKQTVSYKPYHSISVEAVADIESSDDWNNAYHTLREWVSRKINESADEETEGDRPKPYNYDNF
ncbi:MAG: hypothetical protein F6J93_19865 [Oscillatoria sp. SIO1A7]|nr:hypothetical protein [Oscillatoria sp. SIO1A7]